MRRRVFLLLVAVGLLISASHGSYAASDPVEAYVERLYVIVLGRAPDPPGLAHNVSFTRAQGNVKDITVSFLTCPEFLSGRGTDDYTFIECLYLVALDRYPDEAGWDHHVNLLRTGRMTREELIDGFLATPEFLSKDPFANGAYEIRDLHGYYDVLTVVARDDTGYQPAPGWFREVGYIDPSDPLGDVEMTISTPTFELKGSLSKWATSPTTFSISGFLEADGNRVTMTGEGRVYADRSYLMMWTWEWQFADDPNVYYTMGLDVGMPM